jgi:hypothetical protein
LLAEEAALVVVVRGAMTLAPLVDRFESSSNDSPSARYRVTSGPVLPALLEAVLADLRAAADGRRATGELRPSARSRWARGAAGKRLSPPAGLDAKQTKTVLEALTEPLAGQERLLLAVEVGEDALDPQEWMWLCKEVFPSLPSRLVLAFALADTTLELSLDGVRALDIKGADDPAFQAVAHPETVREDEPASKVESSETTDAQRWDLVLQIVGASAGLAAWVAVVGGAAVWARLAAAHLPTTQTLAVLPRELFVVEGLRTLLFPLLLGAIVALLLYFSRGAAPRLARGRPGVGSPAPSATRHPETPNGFASLRPMRTVLTFQEERGRTATAWVAGLTALGLLAIVLVIAEVQFVVLGVGLAVAVIAAVATAWRWPTAGLLVFALAILVVVVLSLGLVVEFEYVVLMALVTVAAVWLTLGVISGSGAGAACLALFFALAIWSGVLGFVQERGDRDPELTDARVDLADRSEHGYLLGRTGDRILLAKATTPITDPIERHVLAIDQEDVKQVVVGASVQLPGSEGDLLDDSEQAIPQAEPPERQAPGPTQPGDDQGGTGGGETGVDVAGPGPPLTEDPAKSEQVRIADVDLRLDVFPAVRTNDLIVLNLRLANLNAEGGRSFRIGGLFSETGTAEGVQLSGIRVTDPVNKRQYDIARDQRDVCVCGPGGTIAAGNDVRLSASFGAPPGTVGHINVTIPAFGTFDGIPVR